MAVRETIIIGGENMRQRVLNLIAALNIEKPWEITVAPHRKSRTLSQNSYMHAIIDELGRAIGYTPAEMKQVLKEELLTPKVVEFRGTTRKLWPETSGMDIAELGEFIDGIHRIAAEQGVLLTLPEERHAA